MKISVITVVLNNRAYVEGCIESVLGQMHKDVEYIIVDGGSTDGTVDVIRNYEKHISKWISEQDNGIYDAMNKGIQMATGDVLGMLNSDDFYPNRDVLAKVSRVFKETGAESCYGDLDYVGIDDVKRVFRSWKSSPYRDNNFFWGWMPPHPTFFARRRIYEQYGVFNLNLGSAADYELMLRFLLRHRIRTFYIPEVLVRMRTGGVSNRSIKNRLVANSMDRYAWKVNGIRPYPWTLMFKPLRKINQYFFN
jgi:glycosyltransferase involved in cell wall biosynthesis